MSPLLHPRFISAFFCMTSVKFESSTATGMSQEGPLQCPDFLGMDRYAQNKRHFLMNHLSLCSIIYSVWEQGLTIRICPFDVTRNSLTLSLLRSQSMLRRERGEAESNCGKLSAGMFQSTPFLSKMGGRLGVREQYACFDSFYWPQSLCLCQ